MGGYGDLWQQWGQVMAVGTVGTWGSGVTPHSELSPAGPQWEPMRYSAVVGDTMGTLWGGHGEEVTPQ